MVCNLNILPLGAAVFQTWRTRLAAANASSRRHFTVQSIDHIVMTCRDVRQTVSFYEKLGLRSESFGPRDDRRSALTFGPQKINLHQYKSEFEPKAALPTPGSQDICFVIEGDVQSAKTKLHGLNIPIIEGPVSRTGALGKLTSIYLRDPDGNLIELATYDE